MSLKQLMVNAKSHLQELEKLSQIRLATLPMPTDVLNAPLYAGSLLVGLFLKGTIEEALKKSKEEEAPAFPSMGASNTTPSMPDPNNDDDEKAEDKGKRSNDQGSKETKEKLVYEDAKYHHKNSSGLKSPAPKDGQSALNNSVEFSKNSLNRVGVDAKNNEFVVLHRTESINKVSKYHGHIRPWNELKPRMQNALIKAGKVTKKGKIIKK